MIEVGPLQSSEIIRSELVRRAPKVPRKILDRLDVAVDGSLSVITTLEFFEHHFAKVGHRCSPYDPTLSAHRHTPDTEHAKASAAKASFKRASRKLDAFPGYARAQSAVLCFTFSEHARNNCQKVLALEWF